MWVARFIGYGHPGTFIDSGGAGTMGSAVPAATGPELGRPATAVRSMVAAGTGNDDIKYARDMAPV